jgi:hypothetical protein
MALFRLLDILALPSVPDEGAEFRYHHIGYREGVAVEVVESPGYLAGYLHMGHIVLAYGDQVGPGQEYVSCLEYGVAHEAEGHFLDMGIPGPCP